MCETGNDPSLIHTRNKRDFLLTILCIYLYSLLNYKHANIRIKIEVPRDVRNSKGP